MENYLLKNVPMEEVRRADLVLVQRLDGSLVVAKHRYGRLGLISDGDLKDFLAPVGGVDFTRVLWVQERPPT